MFAQSIVVALLLLLLLIALQIRAASGTRLAVQFVAVVLPVAAGVWFSLEAASRVASAAAEDPSASEPMTSLTCAKCHESHYASWHRTFHRTMTQEARPDTVKGSFDGAPHTFLGVTVRMTYENDRFWMECQAPAASRRTGSLDGKGGNSLKISVDRLIGSHWFQQLLHCDAEGRYVRLPIVYHIEEGRWIHVNGRFLAKDGEFFSKFSVWNTKCLFCHNTRPAANPQPHALPGTLDGYRTTVGELGISCEACHGSAENHVRAYQNPVRRWTHGHSEEADPTIVNPARLSAAQSSEICGHCHSGSSPRQKEWNRTTLADPFLPGRDLKRFWNVFYSDKDFKAVADAIGGSPWTMRSGSSLGDAGPCCDLPRPEAPGALDGKFWGDGTPLSTAVEFPGMSLSACYEGGRGKMSCLSCHAMHGGNPNHQLKEGMRTNAACYSCHEDYRAKLVQHTHHAAESSGSLCLNCHMPHQVYGMLSARRTHRITIPRIKDSLGTGKPHACNLCHLDKSLGWTQEQLGQWYGTKQEPLADDDRLFASSVVSLAQGDARTRAVFAAAFSRPEAQATAGRDWPVLLLSRVLEHERFQAVRYSAHKSLLSLHGALADGYEYQSSPTMRTLQLRKLQARLETGLKLDRQRYPYLPLKADGSFADDVFLRLLKSRNDPDVTINE